MSDASLAKPDATRVASGWPAVAGLAALGVAASLVGAEAELAFAAVLILAGGLPHGASDHLVAARAGSRWAAGRLALFLLAYGAELAGTLLLWWAAPGLSLALFLALSAFHFGLDDLPNTPWRERKLERLVRGLAPVTLPAVFHAEALGALYGALSSPAWGSALSEAGRWAAPFALAGLLVTLLRRGRAREEPEGRSAAELVLLALGLILLPPLVGFALYFALVHSREQTRERMRALELPSLRAYLVATAPTLAGAALLFAGLGIAAALGHAPPLVPLFVGLAALTVPHMLVTPFFERGRS